MATTHFLQPTPRILSFSTDSGPKIQHINNELSLHYNSLYIHTELQEMKKFAPGESRAHNTHVYNLYSV